MVPWIRGTDGQAPPQTCRLQHRYDFHNPRPSPSHRSCIRAYGVPRRACSAAMQLEPRPTSHIAPPAPPEPQRCATAAGCRSRGLQRCGRSSSLRARLTTNLAEVYHFASVHHITPPILDYADHFLLLIAGRSRAYAICGATATLDPTGYALANTYQYHRGSVDADSAAELLSADIPDGRANHWPMLTKVQKGPKSRRPTAREPGGTCRAGQAARS